MDVAGAGPVAVLESGLGEGRHGWGKVVPLLAPCLTVVTYDRSGIGSGPARRDAAAPVLAASVARELRGRLLARGLPAPYLLVGHSLGGLYVQAFARSFPELVAGIVLVDAASPLEPPGVFVSTVPPPPGSHAAAEEAGVAPSMDAMLAGPPLPPVPLVVLAATEHGDTPDREALWQEVQRRTAALSPRGRLVTVESGHAIQADRPDSVLAAVLSVARQAGMDVSACGA
jgi:pimeloyl-ACP methyl ester carboxylesterase